MKFSDQDYSYFSGEKFSKGYKLELKNNPLYDRIETILYLVKNKRVMHIGCCDHQPLILNKIKEHRWLQGRLDDSCSHVIGVDINQEAVTYVNKHKLSKNPIYHADVTSDEFLSIVPKCKIDYVLLGEILEHVDNPVLFLSNMREVLIKYGFEGEYIITVPNAFSLQIGEYTKGVELINSDHKYWFTPFTLGKVMFDAGIKPLEVIFVDSVRGCNGANWFTNLFFHGIAKIKNKPSVYKSFRSGQMICIGK